MAKVTTAVEQKKQKKGDGNKAGGMKKQIAAAVAAEIDSIRTKEAEETDFKAYIHSVMDEHSTTKKPPASASSTTATPPAPARSRVTLQSILKRVRNKSSATS